MAQIHRIIGNPTELDEGIVPPRQQKQRDHVHDGQRPGPNDQVPRNVLPRLRPRQMKDRQQHIHTDQTSHEQRLHPRRQHAGADSA